LALFRGPVHRGHSRVTSVHPLCVRRAIQHGDQRTVQSRHRRGHAMNSRNMLTGFFLVLAVLTEGAIALSSTKGNNSVTVLARGPAGLRIEGKGSEVSLEEDDSALTFKVPLAPIETGISLRD